MKAINGHLRNKFDRQDLKAVATSTRTALKKFARKQLRAAERRVVLREEIGGFFKERALDVAEAAACARAKELADTRLRARAAIDTRRFLNALQQQAQEVGEAVADLGFLAGRVLVETPVRVIRNGGADTVMVRASCAV